MFQSTFILSSKITQWKRFPFFGPNYTYLKTSIVTSELHTIITLCKVIIPNCEIFKSLATFSTSTCTYLYELRSVIWKINLIYTVRPILKFNWFLNLEHTHIHTRFWKFVIVNALKTIQMCTYLRNKIKLFYEYHVIL